MSEETYTLEEVKQLCKAAFDDGHVAGYYDEQSKDGNWWIENYLPETPKDGKAALNPFRKNIAKTKPKENFNILKRRNNDNNPAMKEKMTTTEEMNPDNQTSNPTWVGNWVWTDDKVIEAIQYITHHKGKEFHFKGIDYHLKEFKLNDWFEQIGLKKDRIFESNDEEVIMTSGELKQLIDLLRNHS